MARIKISRGDFTDANIIDRHLINMHLAGDEGAGKMIQYTEKRFLWTFLVSGTVDGRYTVPRNVNTKGQAKVATAQTMVGEIPANELIDGNARKYSVMGRIQKASVITSLVGVPTTGTTNAGGTFTLKMRDNYLYPGMNAIFFNGKIARVVTAPTGVAGGFVVRFQCAQPGETFVYATWVGTQPGDKTCFGGYTTYGEKSLRGYGRLHYPSKYINHLTLQRKSISISGDANARKILWYEMDGEKGFVFEMEAQTRAQFLLEDDFQKTWGVTNMRDSSGNLLASSGQFDEETGEEIITGDGWLEQVKGQNDYEYSGTNPTWDDLVEWTKIAKKRKNSMATKLWYVMTGTDGYASIQDIAYSRFGANNPLTQAVQAGSDVEVGYNFVKFHINGEIMIFVQNPQMDDEEKFPRKLSDGSNAMSKTFYLIDAGSNPDNQRNIEILAKGRNGINRNLVFYHENGMTGMGKPESPTDAMSFHWLKQNNIFVYDTGTSGIMYPGATA